MQSTQELPCARRYHVEYIASIRIAFSLGLEKARLGDVLPDHDVLELWNLRNSAYEKLGSKCREMPKKNSTDSVPKSQMQNGMVLVTECKHK